MLLVVAVIVCGGAADVAAQSIRPSRPYRGLFGGGAAVESDQTRHELALTASILAGYDDYLAPQSSAGPVDPTLVGQGGYSALADLGLRYWYGRTARALSIDARTFSTTYSNFGANPTLGGDLVVSAWTEFTSRNRLQATQSITYSPTLVMGAFEGLATDVDPELLPDWGIGSGLVEQRSWGSTSSLAIARRWTSRQTGTVNLSYWRRSYLNQLGYDSAGAAINASYSWNMNRFVALGANYDYSDTIFEETTDDGTPLTNHGTGVTVSFRKRISPSRQLQLTGGGGATHVDSVSAVDHRPQSYWLPTGHGTLRLDVGRSWALGADYRRSIGVLQGVTLETFATDALSIRADGTAGPRFEVAFSLAYATGQAGIGGDPGQYESYGANAQLRYGLARWGALSLNYDYYRYSLEGIADVPTSLPPNYDRNALRIGFTFWFPLYGTYTDTSARRASSER
jgi:hypothetical protein